MQPVPEALPAPPLVMDDAHLRQLFSFSRNGGKAKQDGKAFIQMPGDKYACQLGRIPPPLMRRLAEATGEWLAEQCYTEPGKPVKAASATAGTP